MLLLSAVYAQEKPIGNIPILIPPSPEVAELGRIGQVSSNLFTGASSVNISLHEVTAGIAKVPLALSYSNNGIRVSEIPGRAGLGWSIIAGGVVSREVRDEPDDQSEFLTPPNFADPNQELLSYLRQASSYEYDTEHDLYSFNAGGVSGRFYFDETGTPRFISHSNVRITTTGTGKDISVFVITTADGVMYFFGENNTVEKTREINLNKDSGPISKKSKTSWFLTRVVTPEGQTINFNYSPIFIKTRMGPVQFVDLEKVGHVADPINDNCKICKERFGVVKTNAIDYDTQYLTGISTSTGQQVTFTYEQRPDPSGDNRLTDIQVSTSASVLKKYKFEYFDVVLPGNPGVNRKFFLTKLRSLPASGTSSEQQHVFEYYNPQNTPSQFDTGVDYFGYYNGVKTNTNVFPKPTNPSTYRRADEGANRTPSSGSATTGAMKKVTYPTGGSEEFFYEGHNMSALEDQITYTNLNLGTDGSDYDSPKQVTTTITPLQTQKVEISFLNMMSSGAPAPEDPNYWPPLESRRRIATLEISNGTTVLKKDIWDYGTFRYEYNFTANVSYQFKVTVYGSTNYASVQTSYDPVTTQVRLNKPGCGIRVSRIASFDPVQNAINNKYFKYESLESPGVSSAVGVFGGAVVESGLVGGYCYVLKTTGLPVWGEVLTECPTIASINSVSPSISPTFNGSVMAYKYVIESDHPDFANGGVEHEFTAFHDIYSAYSVLNSQIRNAPQSLVANDNGQEKRTLYFKKDVTGTKKVKEVFNYYNVKGLTGLLLNHSIRKRWGETKETYVSYVEKVSPWDVNEYSYSSGWLCLDSTKTINYNDAGQTPVTERIWYQYSNREHTLPTQIQVEESNKEVRTSELKYPADFQTPVYQAMVSKHIISPVIKETVKLGSSIVYTTQTDYKDWFADGKIYKPELVKGSYGTNDLEDLLRYYAYDNKGNPLEMSKVKGPHLTYMWGYGGIYPIAEISNAAISEVWHSNFEEIAGFDANVIKDFARSHTGKFSGKIVNISPSAMTVTANNWLQVLPGEVRKFAFSGWVYSEGPSAKFYLAMKKADGTISYSDAEELTSSATGKWIYLRKDFQVPADIAQLSIRVDDDLPGTIWIDDLRIYPSDGAMTTYTYEPFIGMKSSIDDKGLTTYYEYDNFNRLKIIRDQNDNVIKMFCYNYAGQQLDCGTGGVVAYSNAAKSQTFTRNNCGTGGAGSQVVYSVPSGKHTSTISQADADAKAQNDLNTNGQNYANANGQCSYLFSNAIRSQSFTRNNCSTGGTGSQVIYTVNAGAYTSTISQADADAKAQNDVATNGQSYANANGSCTYSSTAKSQTFSKACSAGGAGSQVTYTVNAGAYTSTISQADADAKAQDDVATNGQTYANNNGNCTYSNAEVSRSFSKDNCTGGAGSAVTYTVPAGKYTSTISQADANALAENDINANGQAKANAEGQCVFSNVYMDVLITKNDCGDGMVGMSYRYELNPGKYTSLISQADADAKAQNDIATIGQAEANLRAGCWFANVSMSRVIERNNCNTGAGSGVVYTVPAGKYLSRHSQADANTQAENEINTNGQAYANANGTCLYVNTLISQVFTRNNCTGTNYGGQVTYVVAQGKYTSTISKADADAKAVADITANGQNYANLHGACLPCTGIDKKVINGVCVTGVKTITNSVPNGNQYKCFFKITWPDGSSVTGNEMSNTPCQGTASPGGE